MHLLQSLISRLHLFLGSILLLFAVFFGLHRLCQRLSQLPFQVSYITSPQVHLFQSLISRFQLILSPRLLLSTVFLGLNHLFHCVSQLPFQVAARVLMLLSGVRGALCQCLFKAFDFDQGLTEAGVLAAQLCFQVIVLFAQLSLAVLRFFLELG